jgi:hypothetical protein
LAYRGYAIEELAEKSTFLEVAYLLMNGDLPNKQQLSTWSEKIMTHTYLHEDLTTMMKSFRYIFVFFFIYYFVSALFYFTTLLILFFPVMIHIQWEF